MLGWSLHIGEVPDFETLSERFINAAESFNKKLVSSETQRFGWERRAPKQVFWW